MRPAAPRHDRRQRTSWRDLVSTDSDQMGTSYRPAIDGYRGLFIILVMLYHFGVTELAGGWVGINHFFTFSGFLIGGILIKEWQRRGRIDAVRFYLRRARRIVPAMVLLVTAVLAHTLLVDSGDRPQTAGDAFATITFWQNWRPVSRDDQYFDLLVEPSPLRHVWTLGGRGAVLPPRPLRRGGRPARAPAVGTHSDRPRAGRRICGLDRAPRRGGSHRITPLLRHRRPRTGDPRRPGRRDAHDAGPTRASPSTEPIRRRGDRLGRHPAVDLGLFPARRDRPLDLRARGMVIFAVMAACMSASALDPRPLRINRLMGWSPPVHLGQISYGLYLFHWPITIWLPMDGLPMAPAIVIKLVPAWICAVLSYRFVELPVMIGGFRALVPRSLGRGLRQWAAPTVIAALAAVSLALSTVWSPLINGDWDGTPLSATAEYRPPAGGLKVAVVGSSIAQSIRDGFRGREYPGLDVSGHTRRGSCNPVPITFRYMGGGEVEEDPTCASWRSQWPGEVRGSGAQIVLSPIETALTQPMVIDGRTFEPGAPEHDRQVRRAPGRAARADRGRRGPSAADRQRHVPRRPSHRP
uniref:Acyltransferase n=1 Tax=Janibacter limosus TaxID=53458 RepID=A0AC61U5G5_9MICO|nr:acyltransferase [Janibacter limosus]